MTAEVAPAEPVADESSPGGPVCDAGGERRKATLTRLSRLEARVRDLLESSGGRRRGDARYRGLILARDDIDALFERGPNDGAVDCESTLSDSGVTVEPGLADFCRAHDLDSTDLDLLVIALAPDLDARFERFYAYIHDDVTQRRATLGLALELVGADTSDPEWRRRLTARSALVANGLVAVDDNAPFLSRGLRVPDVVATYLVGDEAADPAITHLMVDPLPSPSPFAGGVARAVTAGGNTVYLREGMAGGAVPLAAAVCHELGVGYDAFDLRRLRPGESEMNAARAALRQARLGGRALIVGPVEAFDGTSCVLAGLVDTKWLVFLTGTSQWQRRWSTRTPLTLEAPPASAAERVDVVEVVAGPVDGDLAPALAPFEMDLETAATAADLATLRAAIEGRRVTVRDVLAGARAATGIDTDGSVRRIEAAASWSDLVLPQPVLSQLRRLVTRVRQRPLVYETWGLRGGNRGSGVTALFAGPSGTGKTLSAEVIAHELGVELHTVDLSVVVDKYIGETEKNLERVFGTAERSTAVLFFDEADALFGKRAEVRDAKDRYANLETAYLLQRLESFSGIAVLATNLLSNLDEAFARRLDDIVRFPMPDTPARRALWDRLLGDVLPRAQDLDLGFCAERFEMAGGSIVKAVATAGFLAAERGAPLRMQDLIVAVALEYRKMGHLCTENDFGDWFDVASEAQQT